MTLQPFDEWRAEQDELGRRARELQTQGTPSGVACPKCGAELFLQNVVQTSWPPRRSMICHEINCNFHHTQLEPSPFSSSPYFLQAQLGDKNDPRRTEKNKK